MMTRRIKVVLTGLGCTSSLIVTPLGRVITVALGDNIMFCTSVGAIRTANEVAVDQESDSCILAATQESKTKIQAWDQR